jgi:hypothetical protein
MFKVSERYALTIAMILAVSSAIFNVVSSPAVKDDRRISGEEPVRSNVAVVM